MDLLSEPILYHEKITVGNDMIKLTGWIEQVVYSIAHFLNDNGSFIIYDEFNRKYNTNVNFLLYNGCKMAVRNIYKKQN